MEASTLIRPVIKWAGGKSRLVPELLARVPARFGRYFEPFAGGAALFFGLGPERAVLGDLNADLMTTYRALASDPERIIRELRVHARNHGAAYFYAMRDAWNARRAAWGPVRRAAAFIYLNRTCFNGLWRVNRAGAFNVPLGRYASPAICLPELVLAAHVALRRAELRVGDYRDTLRDVEPGDLVYLDPPYVPVSRTAKFTSYASGDFGEHDQRELVEVARSLVSRGCHVIASNSDTPLVRSLYRAFRVDRVRCTRAINSRAERRGEVDELIIVGR